MRLLLFSLFLFTHALTAQTAALQGLVTDDTGAMIPRAQVTAQSGAFTSTALADAAGVYNMPGLRPGTYFVTAATAGLATFKAATIKLNEGTQTLNLTLKVIATQQQLTIRDELNAVSTDASANASALVIKGEDLESLADNPDDLAADLQALAGPSAGPGGGSIFIDGFSGGEIPPKSSIREIRVNQNPFSPEFDKLGYGRIEIFTKPGSDKYHGTVDYNLGTDRWNSRNPYTSTKAPLLLNEFEGGGGGPLGKRASFTLDGQRNTVSNGFVVNAVTLNPQNFAIQPFSTVYETPQRFSRLSPRVDYALSGNNTLSARYSWTQAEIDGSGIGSFDLPSRGYRVQYTHHLAQLTETAVVGSTINETRFQFYQDSNRSTPFDSSPTLQVLGAFNGNGSQIGRASFTQTDYELQNITSLAKGAHFLRFGLRLRGNMYTDVSPANFNGTFTFGGGLAPDLLNSDSTPQPITSIERYRRTLLLQSQGVPPDRIRALGGGATQFSISSGDPNLSAHQTDAGLFVGDEWRLRPNFTVSLGVRYEIQSNISDWRNLAPRIAIAWSPKKSKTVVRAGFGTFYDRFALGNTVAAQRFNGIVQQQYVVANPDFFPTIPSLSSLAAARSTQVIERVASDLRAPYLLQTVISLERQLPAHTTLAVTYTNARGIHLLRSRPLTGANPIFLRESSGIYNQNQFIANMNSKISTGFSFFSFYVFNRARSDTDGIGTYIANPNSYIGEYGPAATDIRHRLTLGGSLSTRWNVRLSPFVILNSGPPFDITTGRDVYGTTLFNGRPGLPTDLTKAGLVRTEYGVLDPNPTPGEAPLGRNFGRGPGQRTVNLRVAKTIGFGRSKESSTSGAQTASNPGGGAISIPGGGQIRSVIGAPSTSRRYNLVLSMSIRNLLNHNNPGPIIGDLTSPLFGRANRVAGAPNGEGFSENASNRRLEMQLRLNF